MRGVKSRGMIFTFSSGPRLHARLELAVEGGALAGNVAGNSRLEDALLATVEGQGIDVARFAKQHPAEHVLGLGRGSAVIAVVGDSAVGASFGSALGTVEDIAGITEDVLKGRVDVGRASRNTVNATGAGVRAGSPGRRNESEAEK